MCVCVCVFCVISATPSFEESHIKWRGVKVDELEDEHLKNEGILKLGLCSMHLCETKKKRRRKESEQKCCASDKSTCASSSRPGSLTADVLMRQLDIYRQSRQTMENEQMLSSQKSSKHSQSRRLLYSCVGNYWWIPPISVFRNRTLLSVLLRFGFFRSQTDSYPTWWAAQLRRCRCCPSAG